MPTPMLHLCCTSGLLGFPGECHLVPHCVGDCLWSLISGLQQSHHHQPLPPVSIPSGLVIKSLIIHHYSNHYLPFPGLQWWLRGIQNGSRTTPPPLKPPQSKLICGTDRVYLLGATSRKTLSPARALASQVTETLGSGGHPLPPKHYQAHTDLLSLPTTPFPCARVGGLTRNRPQR